MAREKSEKQLFREPGWLRARLREIDRSARWLGDLMGVDEKQVRRWDSGEYAAPDGLDEWLGRRETMSDLIKRDPPPVWGEDAEADDHSTRGASSQTRGGAVSMTPTRARECLEYLGWSQRGMADLLQWKNERGARRWFTGQEPIPPAIAQWLEAVVAAKRRAEEAIPRDMDPVTATAVVSAALVAALGDPAKVRELALQQERVERLRQLTLSGADAVSRSDNGRVTAVQAKHGGPASSHPRSRAKAS